VKDPALLVCVMGVSAAGKTTVGNALAAAIGVPFLDADALHSDANRAKMASGTPPPTMTAGRGWMPSGRGSRLSGSVDS